MTNETSTYKKAKEIFNTAELKKDLVLDIEAINVPIFRKHLSEMIKRQDSPKRFVSRLLNKNQIKVIRIA
jgi:hypothetical protein